MIYAHYNTFYTEQKRTENYEKKKKKKKEKEKNNNSFSVSFHLLNNQFPSFEQSVFMFTTSGCLKEVVLYCLNKKNNS